MPDEGPTEWRELGSSERQKVMKELVRRHEAAKAVVDHAPQVDALVFTAIAGATGIVGFLAKDVNMPQLAVALVFFVIASVALVWPYIPPLEGVQVKGELLHEVIQATKEELSQANYDKQLDLTFQAEWSRRAHHNARRIALVVYATGMILASIAGGLTAIYNALTP